VKYGRLRFSHQPRYLPRALCRHGRGARRRSARALISPAGRIAQLAASRRLLEFQRKSAEHGPAMGLPGARTQPGRRLIAATRCQQRGTNLERSALSQRPIPSAKRCSTADGGTDGHASGENAIVCEEARAGKSKASCPRRSARSGSSWRVRGVFGGCCSVSADGVDCSLPRTFCVHQLMPIAGRRGNSTLPKPTRHSRDASTGLFIARRGVHAKSSPSLSPRRQRPGPRVR